MSELVTARQESFARGMNDAAAPEEYAPNEVAILYDGRLELAGNGVTRRGGSQRTHPSALNGGATVYGLTEFRAGDGTRYLVAAVGDTIYQSSDEGATWSQIATGLREDYWSFAVTDACGKPTLYGANGDTDIYSWDGTTWGTLTGEPSGVKYIAVFAGRLYAAGHDEETVQASMVKDFDDWTIANGALNVKVATHDGDTEIRGLYQLGEAILVWKRESMGYIAGYGFETLQVEAGPEGGVSRSVGLTGFRTVQATAEDAVVWLSERGWEYYRLGGQPQLIGRPMQGFHESLNHDHIASNPATPVAAYWPRKNEYWCAVPTGSNTENDRIFVWRPPGGNTTPAQWLFRPSFAVSDLAMADRSGEGKMPYASGYDGLIRELETGDRDDVASDGTGGSEVELVLRTRPFTMGSQQIFKKGRIGRAAVRADGGASYDLSVVSDGEEEPGRTVKVGDARGPISRKARLLGRGYVLGLQLSTSSALTIQGLELEIEPQRRGW